MKLYPAKTYAEMYHTSSAQNENNQDSWFIDWESLDKFFDGRLNEYTGSDILATNVGQVACNNLANAISAAIAPRTGSWISTVPDTDPEDSDTTLLMLREKLLLSGFYPAVTRLVKDCLIYNFGFISSWYYKGIQYDNPEITDVFRYNSEKDLAAYFIMQTMSTSEAKQKYLNSHVVEGSVESGFDSTEVVQCYVPTNDTFVESVSDKKFKYIRIDMLAESEVILINRQTKREWTGFVEAPFTSPKHSLNERSLASLAYNKALDAHEKAKEFNLRAYMVNRPPTVLDINAFNQKRVDLTPNGLIVISANERDPKTVKYENELNIDMQMLMKSEQDVREIFLWNHIERLDNATMSTPEDAKIYLNFLDKINPLVGDKVFPVLDSLVKQAHRFLKRYDNDYESKLVDTDIITGINQEKERAEAMVGFSRMAGMLQYVQQASPVSIDYINFDKAVQMMPKMNGWPSLERSKNEVMRIRMSRQMSQASPSHLDQSQAANQQAQAVKNISDVQKNQAEAEMKTAEAQQMQNQI